MKQRIFTGLALAFSLICLLYQPYDLFLFLVAASLACWGYVEFDQIFFKESSLSRRLRLCTLIVLAIWTLAYATQFSSLVLWLPLFLLSLRQVVFANRDGNTEWAVKELAYELMGFYYVVCLFGFLVPIAQVGPYGRAYLLLLFLIVFFGDVTAFFVGRKWGRHSLASQISPRKSIEGSIGAVLGALAITWFWTQYLYPGPITARYQWTLFTLIPVLSLLAQVGDLLESLFKRSRHRKDSGKALPGHGGILDRVDGLALASPFFYFFLSFVLERL
jgi:phosphatidate cytidylyltransferase